MELFYIIFSYLVGGLLFADIVSFLNGKKIRESGSKNPGATNMLRTQGKMAGALTLIGDIIKVWIGIYIIKYTGASQSIIPLCTSCMIIGHIYSPYKLGKGGKGVATFIAANFIISLQIGLLTLLSMICAILFTKRVSVAAIITMVINPLILLMSPYGDQWYLPMAISGYLIVMKHASNIENIINGKEGKIQTTTIKQV